MARLARAEVFDPDEVAIAHVDNRTARRCFLMVDEPVSGKKSNHRKVWIEQYLEQIGIALLLNSSDFLQVPLIWLRSLLCPLLASVFHHNDRSDGIGRLVGKLANHAGFGVLDLEFGLFFVR